MKLVSWGRNMGEKLGEEWGLQLFKLAAFPKSVFIF